MEGLIIHAELDFDCGRLQLGAAQEAYHLLALDPGARTRSSRWVSMSRMLTASSRLLSLRGALSREPVVGFVSGNRYGSIRDPFGTRWSVMTRVEDLSNEESDRRIDAWAEEMSAQNN